MTVKVPFRDVVSHYISGGWGTDAPSEASTQVAIIRGADFPNVQVGSYGDVPIRWESNKKLPKRVLQEGDIVLEISGGTADRPTGRTAYISSRLLNSFTYPVIPASFCKLVRVNPEKVDSSYAYWWLQNMYQEGRAWAYQNRSTGIANFQFEYFLDTELINLVPMKEQRAIAATLGALDDKIESNMRITRIGEELVRTLVDAALDSSTGEEIKFETYCELVRETVKPEHISSNENYVALEHMTKGSLFLSTSAKAEAIGSNKTRFKKGDILFGKLRPYFKKVAIAPFDGVCSTDILVLRPRSPKNLALVAAIAGSDALIEAVSASATGTRMPRTSWKDIASWGVPTLDDKEREKLASETSTLVARLQRLYFENQQLALLRDALLPELMSGRVRVPEAREVVEDTVDAEVEDA
ncbi:MAG: restriction endonuclease subunit S [Actinomycetaceae bacterium]|nr:restriction endonuclease subunit S [Actinomycetaceae bacterium]